MIDIAYQIILVLLLQKKKSSSICSFVALPSIKQGEKGVPKERSFIQHKYVQQWQNKYRILLDLNFTLHACFLNSVKLVP